MKPLLNRSMKRRDFVRSLTLAAVGGSVFTMRKARAELPALNHPVLAHLMMLGGPDFRHLLPPAFDPTPASYGYRFYEQRAKAYRIESDAASLARRWNEGYIHLQDGQRQFGMLNGCDWLADMWRDGHVAIVNNVFAAVSRDHAHAQLVWESADRTLTQTSRALTGWAGRLADQAGNRVLSLTTTPRSLCFSRSLGNPEAAGTSRIITLANPSSVGVFEAADDADPAAKGISQALKQYYAALNTSLPLSAPQRGFVDHEQTLRLVGTQLREVFANLTVPSEISGLLGPNGLATAAMAAQTRNLFFALAGSAVTDFHVASMAFGNWDSHDKQQEEIEPKFRDIFGANGALANLYRVLPEAVSGQLVFMFSGEFGRQLKANGGEGTDHGRGNSVLLVGFPVRGGHYGDPFPAAELSRLDEDTPDIEGATHLDSLLKEVVDYLVPGSSSAVLPGLSTAVTETNVNLGLLFSL